MLQRAMADRLLPCIGRVAPRLDEKSACSSIGIRLRTVRRFSHNESPTRLTLPRCVQRPRMRFQHIEKLIVPECCKRAHGREDIAVVILTALPYGLWASVFLYLRQGRQPSITTTCHPRIAKKKQTMCISFNNQTIQRRGIGERPRADITFFIRKDDVVLHRGTVRKDDVLHRGTVLRHTNHTSIPIT